MEAHFHDKGTNTGFFDRLKGRFRHPKNNFLIPKSKLAWTSQKDNGKPTDDFSRPTYKHDDVRMAAKRVVLPRFQVTSTVRREVEQLRGLLHHNLCGFVGLCTENDQVWILSEYCARGNLIQALNYKVTYDWNFRLDFALDLAEGMAYLESHGITHGRLKANNCIIDKEVRAKIADFGLESVRCRRSVGSFWGRGGARGVPIAEEEFTPYHAPELRAEDWSSTALARGDRYAFGVILYVMVLRKEPTEVPSDPDVLFRAIRTEAKGLEPYQRDQMSCPVPAQYHKLIQDCLYVEPHARLTFRKIKSRLKRIMPEKEAPIVRLVRNLEKSQDILEMRVHEQTIKLQEEKKRADKLLERYMPPSIVEKLKLGQEVLPENFESTTILFSDLVHFTAYANDTPAPEVLAMLNRIFTIFDSVVKNYDAFTIDIIGDSYIVGSGFPATNGISHVAQISGVALDMLQAFKEFSAENSPCPKIRFGIASGPVCAGVIGTRLMPRYTILGDTMNVASRIESSSLPNRIQISEPSYKLLQQTGGFEVRCRGQLDVKGKGKMTSYWLLGREGDEIDDVTEPDLVIAKDGWLEPDSKAVLMPTQPKQIQKSAYDPSLSRGSLRYLPPGITMQQFDGTKSALPKGAMLYLPRKFATLPPVGKRAQRPHTSHPLRPRAGEAQRPRLGETQRARSGVTQRSHAKSTLLPPLQNGHISSPSETSSSTASSSPKSPTKKMRVKTS